MHACMHAYMHACVYADTSIYLSVCLSIYISIYLSIYLSIHLSIIIISPNSFGFRGLGLGLGGLGLGQERSAHLEIKIFDTGNTGSHNLQRLLAHKRQACIGHASNFVVHLRKGVGLGFIRFGLGFIVP